MVRNGKILVALFEGSMANDSVEQLNSNGNRRGVSY